jgi:hypothetical protein
VLDETLAALVPVVGVKPACELIGASRARYYRRNNPPPACEPSRPEPVKKFETLVR